MKTPVPSYKRLSNLYSSHKKARELYSPYPYKGVAAYRMRSVNEKYPFKVRLINLVENQLFYLRAHKWLVESKIGIISDEETMTASNGVVYYVYANFEREEDKIAFILKFPEIV